MQVEDLYRFLHKHRLAVLSTRTPDGSPQSALVGISVSDQLQIVFDTLTTTRKYTNLTADPRISFVIGWESEVTVQYEGIATEPKGEALQQAQEIYFQTWPDGVHRKSWPEITWFLVNPRWIRYSDFDSGHIEEMNF
jgi:pyridoxine/pyridoxamine 5'-phosphate oxidase